MSWSCARTTHVAVKSHAHLYRRLSGAAMLDALSERTDLLDHGHDTSGNLLDLQFRLLAAIPILGIYVKWEVGQQ